MGFTPKPRAVGFSLRLLGLAAVATGLIIALPSLASAAAAPCWQRVIADWSKHGSVTGTYSPSCLRQAMQNVPTDLRIYSNLDDNLRSALALQSQREYRRLAVAPVVAGVDSAGDSSSRLLLVFLVGGLGVIIAASAVAAGRVRPRAAGSGPPPPTPADPGRRRSRIQSRRKAARPNQAMTKLAATSGFLVADRNGKLVGRVECPMYGAAPDKPDAIAVKAGMLKRNLVMADTIDSIDGEAGVIGLNVTRDSIPTFL